ncbi:MULTISPECIES: hypothetical protein [Bacillus cereus group]|nr:MULTISPECIES: hypothetical protein [Bacillus cereus group]WJE23120.1 hypothetical protein QRE65_00430 [Bacillus cereus]
MKKLYFKEVELEELNSSWDNLANACYVVSSGGLILVGGALVIT